MLYIHSVLAAGAFAAQTCASNFAGVSASCNLVNTLVWPFICAAGEDIKKITQGGWVAWKRLGDNAAAGGPLFVKDAFYNFLCPQRPSTV